MDSEVRRNIANQNAVIELVLPKLSEFRLATDDLLGRTISPSFETSAINTLTTSERLLEQQSEEFREVSAFFGQLGEPDGAA